MRLYTNNKNNNNLTNMSYLQRAMEEPLKNSQKVNSKPPYLIPRTSDPKFFIPEKLQEEYRQQCEQI